VPMLNRHHGHLYRQLSGDPAAVAGTDLERQMPGVGRLCSIESDRVFWRVGFEQLLDHPWLYLRNCVLNAGRLLFDYPYTLHNRHHPWTLIALHVAMVGVAAAVAWRRVRGRLTLPPEVEIVGIFALVMTAMSIGLFACGRYFYPLYPAYLLVGLVGTAPERWRPAPEPAPGGGAAAA
jgi:hypothetical protein